MATCSVEGCEKEAVAVGMCMNHRGQLRYAEAHPNKKKYLTHSRGIDNCKHEGCQEPVLCRGLCRKHYRWLTNPPEDRTCKVQGCSEKRAGLGYCRQHYNRFVNKLPLDLKVNCRKGERHWNWKGGTTPYPHDFRNLRLIRLNASNGNCERCGRPARVVHHKDGNTQHNELSNLTALCHPCHRHIHSGNRHSLQSIGMDDRSSEESMKVMP